ncbi:MAG: hypothetical protein ACRD5M_04175 [Candidatus Acidiferrales bacterium]
MQRRIPSFPVTFEIIKPTRFSPGDCKMYYAHEWEAHQKSLHGDQPNAVPSQPAGETTQPSDQTAAQADIDSAQPTEQLDPDLSAGPAATVAAVPSESSASVYPENSAWQVSKARPPHPSQPPDFSRHARRCAVCSHPDRDAIEGDFIRWRSPELIAREYKLTDRSSIYRHAHSTGLYAWRRREVGRVLEGILEASEHLPLKDADVIIRAARIYSHLDEQGNWFEPPRTTFIFTGPAPAIPPLESVLSTNSARTRERTAKRSRGEQKANRNIRHFKKSIKSMKAKEKANS